MQIDLVTLVVDDYDDAIAFFVDAVGFELAEDSSAVSTMTGADKRWVVVRPPSGGTGLLLAQAADPPQRAVVGAQTGGRVGLFLQTDDFDRQYQRMVDAGVRFVDEVRREPYGTVAVWEDLYGNRWDLIEPVAGSSGSAAGLESEYPIPGDVGDTLIGEAEIAERVKALGAQITADYAGRTPLLVGVLKGSAIFVADLVRAIAGPLDMDFLAVSSYGLETKSSGVVRIIKDLDHEISGRHIIVVEDIVDSGLTLRFLLDHLSAKNPASLATCSLVQRESSQREGQVVDYVGFTLPPAFVVGYGLDAGQRYRNLPYIAQFTGDQ